VLTLPVVWPVRSALEPQPLALVSVPVQLALALALSAPVLPQRPLEPPLAGSQVLLELLPPPVGLLVWQLVPPAGSPVPRPLEP
jgi:hypothetical protein